MRGVIAGYAEVLGRLGVDYELLLITNGCTDDSERIARDLARESTAVRTLNLDRGGWGRSVRAGLAEVRGTTVCYANSARTTPEMLALTLSYSRAYPEVVVKANRKVRDSRRRRLGSLLYNLECRALFDLPVWDVNGTPKVFPRGFDALLTLERDDDLIDAEFLAVCKEEGYPIIEVPVLATTRHGGSSTTGYRSALLMYLGALQLKRQRAPR